MILCAQVWTSVQDPHLRWTRPHRLWHRGCEAGASERRQAVPPRLPCWAYRPNQCPCHPRRGMEGMEALRPVQGRILGSQGPHQRCGGIRSHQFEHLGRPPCACGRGSQKCTHNLPTTNFQQPSPTLCFFNILLSPKFNCCSCFGIMHRSLDLHSLIQHQLAINRIIKPRWCFLDSVHHENWRED